MYESTVTGNSSGKETTLPRRDWIMLPLVGLLTSCVVTGFIEFAARQFFPPATSNIGNCLVTKDPSSAVHAVPNSTCWERDPEIGIAEYKFDSHGYRSVIKWGPKAPGAYRIVVLGSSIALGSPVPLSQTFAALLPKGLARLTGRDVEVFNEGMFIGFPPSVDLRFNDALAQSPDLILWIVTPLDIVNASVLTFEGQISAKRNRFKEILGSVKESRSAFLFRYLLFRSPTSPMKLRILENSDGGALDAKLSPSWESNLHDFDGYAADIENRAHAGGVPLVVAYVPSRAQAVLSSIGKWSATSNPYKLGQEVHSIVVRHGGSFIDLLPSYRTISNPEKDYVVGGHPNAAGQATIARLLESSLLDGTVPALKDIAHPKTVLGPTR